MKQIAHPKKDGIKLQCYCGASRNIKIDLPPGKTHVSKKAICQNCDNIYLVLNDNYHYSITTYDIKPDKPSLARKKHMTPGEREVLAHLTQELRDERRKK